MPAHGSKPLTRASSDASLESLVVWYSYTQDCTTTVYIVSLGAAFWLAVRYAVDSDS